MTVADDAPRAFDAPSPALAPHGERSLDEIAGIEPYREELARIGIVRPGALAITDPVFVAEATAAPVATVKRWQAAAELLELPGIAPATASLLARAGVDGTWDLARRSPGVLARELNRRAEADRVRERYDEAGVRLWIEEAIRRTAPAWHGP